MEHELEQSAGQDLPDRWLAYELHDGLLQWIVSARMEIEAAIAQLDPQQSRLGDRLKKTLASLENALEEGRELIGFLERQTSDAEIPVESRLALLVERLEAQAAAAGQTIEFLAAEPKWFSMPRRTAWNLLRIAQQAIRNAIQHAGSCTIQVQCGWRNPTTALLVVSDDGRGFDTDLANALPGHYGLASMQHRATLLSARFHLLSAVGRGTTITVEFMQPQT
jgi:signal transduction histidine kinase